MVSSVQTLQLVKRRDADNSDIDSVDLMSVPVELQYEGWQQGTPSQQNQPSVDDVITLLMNAGNANTLATALQSIDSKVKQTQWAQDPLNPIGVWLRTKLATETNTRQAFIQELRRSPALPITDPLMYDSTLQKYQLGVTRMPVWENVLATTITSSAISANGGTLSYSIAGDAHARVGLIESIFNAQDATEIWYGAKSDRYGVNPANFVPRWSLYPGAVSDPDITTTSDATAAAGTRVNCDFSSITTMRTLAAPVMSGVTANLSDQRGKYHALLRWRINSGVTLVCNVRVGTGFEIGGSILSPTYMPRRRLASVNANYGWVYSSLGIIKIPPVSGFDVALGSITIFIQAEKVSGSGTLSLDSIVLIPAEHAVHVDHGTVGIAGSSVKSYIMTRPDGVKSAIGLSSSSGGVIEGVGSLDETTWSLPSGSGVIVCAAGNSVRGTTETANLDTLTPTLTVYPSYSSLRGAV